ncbi:putative limbic system-associated membrane protein precursor [Penaeus vannamei]|uniref:Putative limbic system-associated membrane protein n=1 Tax=Penaeus vannamei TaxID=6689 RepID=A0A423TC16_PENVA|nr:putative limbic system-associated membrane protein precursor [Penaeus vannamei]
MVSLLLPLLLRLLTCASVGGEAQDRPPADGLEKTTSGEGLEGPGATGIFLQTNSSRHLAMVGTTAVLHCHTGDIGESVVSWIRRRDYHLLTVGQHAYSSDERFQVRYVKQDNDWQLHLRYVQVRDAGEYECQVSSHPATSLFSTLKVVEPTAEILGGPEKYIRRGSSLRLVCLLRHYETPPDYVFWYNGERKMINYDQQVGPPLCSLLEVKEKEEPMNRAIQRLPISTHERGLLWVAQPPQRARDAAPRSNRRQNTTRGTGRGKLPKDTQAEDAQQRRGKERVIRRTASASVLAETETKGEVQRDTGAIFLAERDAANRV